MQYGHSPELKHGYKKKTSISLGASYISDLVFFLIQPVDSILTERTPLNFGNAQAYNLTTTFPWTVTKGWTLQATLLGNYSGFRYTYQGIPLHVTQFSGQLNASSAFVFGKDWTAEFSGWLKTPGVNILFYSPWLGTMDVDIQKSIGAKLKAKLSLQDVFHTNRFIGKTIAPGFTSDARLGFDNPI